MASLLSPPTYTQTYDLNPSVSVTNIEGHGKGLLATTNLSSSTQLFVEQAVVFHRANFNLDHVSCDCCGKWLLSEREQLKFALKRMVGVKEPPNNILQQLDPTLPNIIPQTCEGCHLRWCSDECRESSHADGHQYLCKQLSGSGKLRKFLADYSTTTERTFPSAAHFGCAARVLAKVAMHTCPETGSSHLKEHSPSQVDLENKVSFDAAALQETMNEIMGSFFQASFTESLHATRTSSVTSMSENSMFVEHLQPAYRTAYLESGLKLFQETFEPLGTTFRDTLLSDNAFDTLMGIFATNNFAVEFVSPLARLITFSPVWFKSLKVQEFPTIRGTACFKHYAILNHSCDKNTTATCNNTKTGALTISVSTTKAIHEGEEVYNCYLPSPNEMSYKERQCDLCQYMFHCQCSLCAQQKLEQSDSSSGDDY